MILMRHAETVFNVVFGATRRDPGVEDPPLTPRGRDQARAAAETLAAEGVRRIVASPYRRALETAHILGERLDVPVAVEPLVRERAKFACDVGTPRSALVRAWPGVAFDRVAEVWWSEAEEPVDALHARARRFCAAMAARPDWAETAVVTHWGVIRALTGLRITNCDFVRVHPGRSATLTVRDPADACHPPQGWTPDR